MVLRVNNYRHYGVLLPSGRLEGGDLAVIAAAFAEHARKPWAIELSRVDALDDEVVCVVLAAAGRAAAEGVRLAVVAPLGSVADMIDAAEVRASLPVYASLSDFVEECAPAAALAADHPCAPEEHPLALAARRLSIPA